MVIFKKINEVVSYYPKPILGSRNKNKLIMALALDKKTRPPHLQGLVRVITKRVGTPGIQGHKDTSELYLVNGKDYLTWKLTKKLKIKGIDPIVKSRSKPHNLYIGLEDPDIYTDEQRMKHVYFTIPYVFTDRPGYEVYVGHAQGKNLQSLHATEPVAGPDGKSILGFKEVAFAPRTSDEKRLALAELRIQFSPEQRYSALGLLRITDLAQPWQYRGVALDPWKTKHAWIAGEASPLTLLPKEFVSYKDLLVGIVNGRARGELKNGKRFSGVFRVGLLLFNPKTGEIPWVSPEPLFEDPDAKSITFASDFVVTSKNEGLLYAHVDDSFIRAYKIDAQKLKMLLP